MQYIVYNKNKKLYIANERRIIMAEEKNAIVDEKDNLKETEATVEPPKRKRGRPKKVTTETSVQEVKTDTIKEDTEVKEVRKEKSEESSVEPAPKKSRTRKTKQADVLDAHRDARALLKGAQKTMKILTAMIERIEYNEHMKDADTAVTAVVQHSGFRILIPASEMGIDVDEELTRQEKESIYRRYINPMIGANIDFVVRKVDEKTNLAVGSRRIAMAIKKKQIFQNRSRSGKKTQAEWAMEERVPVEAHVMAVAGSTVRIEVFGVETKVLAKDADWIYTANLSDIFCPGDKIKCIIKSINVNEEDKSDIKITASIREAYPNKQIDNAATFKDGSICIGEVTGVNVKGYYVLLGDRATGITGFCQTVRGTEIPAVGDKVSCQINSVDGDAGFAYVNIIRIIQKKARNRF